MRGNLGLSRDADTQERSIPARAGEPHTDGFRTEIYLVYPRACGGTGQTGLFPARAGEPAAGASVACSCGVYPRACGGTGGSGNIPSSVPGLSPRVRGNRLSVALGRGNGRSIPARAGEPCWMRWYSSPLGVYPRACGGTVSFKRSITSVTGLSPRVRGNPATPQWAKITTRSIPARAGEPHAAGTGRRRVWVYPRACGGTHHLNHVGNVEHGLSPRVRGNRSPIRCDCVSNRSIPARAGEPITRDTGRCSDRVYPRACGGTATTPIRIPIASGLSPRVRGNLIAGCVINIG